MITRVQFTEESTEELNRKLEEEALEENISDHVRAACHWALERESVRVKKDAGEPKPWSKEKIFQDYRFCNVNRCEDKETKILFEEFYRPHAQSPDLWFNAAVARWINWSKSVLAIGWTDLSNGYDADDMYRRMREVSLEEKFFTGAYLIRGCTSAKEVGDDLELYEKAKEKRYFLAHVVFKSIYAVGPPEKNETLASYHARLKTAKSNGDFMAGQQIADLKYFTMNNAPDWKTWAPIGPGPVRFLNRMQLRPIEKQIPKPQHYQEIDTLSVLIKNMLPIVAQEEGYPDKILALVENHLQDAHNCLSNLLCETDKYLRLQAGGRVRSKYDGAGSSTISLI